MNSEKKSKIIVVITLISLMVLGTYQIKSNRLSQEIQTLKEENKTLNHDIQTLIAERNSLLSLSSSAIGLATDLSDFD
jgi:cell division protein FtsB